MTNPVAFATGFARLSSRFGSPDRSDRKGASLDGQPRSRNHAADWLIIQSVASDWC